MSEEKEYPKTIPLGSWDQWNGLAVRAQEALPYRDGIDVVFIREHPTDGNKILYVSAVEVEEENAFSLKKPGGFLCLTRTQARMLMNDLWRTGIRPEDFSSTDAEVAAMKEHINDLRIQLNRLQLTIEVDE